MPWQSFFKGRPDYRYLETLPRREDGERVASKCFIKKIERDGERVALKCLKMLYKKIERDRERVPLMSLNFILNFGAILLHQVSNYLKG